MRSTGKPQREAPALDRELQKWRVRKTQWGWGNMRQYVYPGTKKFWKFVASTTWNDDGSINFQVMGSPSRWLWALGIFFVSYGEVWRTGKKGGACKTKGGKFRWMVWRGIHPAWRGWRESGGQINKRSERVSLERAQGLGEAQRLLKDATQGSLHKNILGSRNF